MGKASRKKNWKELGEEQSRKARPGPGGIDTGEQTLDLGRELTKRTEATEDRTRMTGLQLQQGKFNINTEKRKVNCKRISALWQVKCWVYHSSVRRFPSIRDDLRIFKSM